MNDQADRTPSRFDSPPRVKLEYIENASREILRQYVFQPNIPITWAAVRSALSNLLTGLWEEGKLVGATPADAFSVACGLGSTMTGDDILQGNLIAVLNVAVMHPAEFIAITLQETMLGAA